MCLNCEFYAPGRQYDCRETIPEEVRDKDRANFCDYFRLKKNTKQGPEKDKQDKAKDQFNALFSDEN